MNLLSILSRSIKHESDTKLERTHSTTLGDFHIKEAQKLFQTSDYHQALLHCEQALNQDATKLTAYRLRGIIRYELQDYSGATQDLHRSLGLI